MSKGLGITTVLCFFENFLEFLKTTKDSVILKNIEDLRKFQRQVGSKLAKVSLKPFSSEK